MARYVHIWHNDWLKIDSNPTLLFVAYKLPNARFLLTTLHESDSFPSCTPTFAFDSSRSRQPASHSRRASRPSASLGISTAILHNSTSPRILLTPGKSHVYPRPRAMRLLPSCKLHQAACSSGFHVKSDRKLGFKVNLTYLFFSFRAILQDLILGPGDTSY